MPFKSQEELNKMMKTDPAQARRYVSNAKKMGRPVVNSSNPGYREAIKRRLQKSSMSGDKDDKDYEY